MRALRMVPLGLALIVTQVAIFPNLRVFGAVPDLALLAGVAVAWLTDEQVGAWFGFALGLGIDFFLSTPFAMTALAYGVTAYVAGLTHDYIDRRVPILVALSGLGAGVTSGVCFVVMSILAGADQLMEAHTITVIGAVALYDAVLAIPVVALVRFVVGEADGVRI